MAKLKGHAVIELTDVKTGKKERFEHDNLITNAVSDFLPVFNGLFGKYYLNDSMTPIQNGALGGIYLFDNTLTESASNKYLPDASTAKLTGYAGHATSDGNDTQRGDFNASESGEITNGYKFVWDFGTDDANGEIASLALTSAIAGYHGYHFQPKLAHTASKNSTGSTSDNYKGLEIQETSYDDRTGGAHYFSQGYGFQRLTKAEITAYGYYFEIVYFSSTTNLRIQKYKYYTKQVDLEAINLFNLVNAGYEDITITEPEFNNGATYSSFVFADGGDGYYYGFYAPYNGKKMAVCKLNRSTKQYTQCVVVNDCTYGNSSWTGLEANYTGPASFDRPIIRNGYAYMRMQKNYVTNYRYNQGIWKVNLNNLSEATEVYDVSYNDLQGFIGLGLMPNGTIDATLKYITLDDTLIDKVNFTSDTSNETVQRTFIYCGELLFIICNYSTSYNYASFLLSNLQYLATINNLDSPVTKTAAKTMKITYTLTYAE